MQGIAYKALVRAADAGERCPSNEVLRRLIGAQSMGTASDVVRELEQRGLIQVWRGGSCRQVTIVETGRSTYHEKTGPRAAESKQRYIDSQQRKQQARSRRGNRPKPKNRIEQIRAECFREAEGRSDRRDDLRTTSNVQFAKHEARNPDAAPTPIGAPCFLCGAAGDCSHRSSPDAADIPDRVKGRQYA